MNELGARQGSSASMDRDPSSKGAIPSMRSRKTTAGSWLSVLIEFVLDADDIGPVLSINEDQSVNRGQSGTDFMQELWAKYTMTLVLEALLSREAIQQR